MVKNEGMMFSWYIGGYEGLPKAGTGDSVPFLSALDHIQTCSRWVSATWNCDPACLFRA